MKDEPQPPSSRRDLVFFVLAGVFITHALLGELLGGKLFAAWGWIMSIGVIPWPVVFVTTDLVNEYYGPRAVRRLTLLAIVLIVYTFGLLWLCMLVPAASISPVDDASFDRVFGQSMWIIVGSIVAFAISQLLDASVFVALRRLTKNRLLWLRAVGSTVISQLIDTFVINTIAFGLPGKISPGEVLELSVTNYGYKFLVALATLPVIYVGHGVLDRYFARDTD
ncbi:MAG: queuosine precursor transporter [Nannocystaceae bacterium]|nr:queuosine precursor transporter [bacterium]